MRQFKYVKTERENCKPEPETEFSKKKGGQKRKKNQLQQLQH